MSSSGFSALRSRKSKMDSRSVGHKTTAYCLCLEKVKLTEFYAYFFFFFFFLLDCVAVWKFWMRDRERGKSSQAKQEERRLDVLWRGLMRMGLLVRDLFFGGGVLAGVVVGAGILVFYNVSWPSLFHSPFFSRGSVWRLLGFLVELSCLWILAVTAG